MAGGTWGELFNIPLTAHFLGGAVIGDSPEHGVIDPYHRVYGYPTLFVVDGAAISANLGVNPSLSITAQAERAASLWPNKGENDQRPLQGDAYRQAGADRAGAPGGTPRCTGCAALAADRSGQLGELTSINWRVTSKRCAADHAAAFPVHVDGHIAHQRDPMHQPGWSS